LRFTASIFPEEIIPENLDQYLAKGWFRMGQSIFTTNFLTFDNKQYSAVWLRIDLDKFQPEKKLLKLLQGISDFKVEVKPTKIDSEKEELYFRYRESLKFQPIRNLQTLLFDNSLFNIFDSFEVNIRHNSKLVACGIFDCGQNAAEGIVSFYDPQYKKYSLGRILFLKKIIYLQQKGFKFFYPGYFVPGYAPFDYKIKIAPNQTEYFDITHNRWAPLKEFKFENSPLRIIDQKLSNLSTELHRLGIDNHKCIYDLYDVKMMREYSTYDLLDYPRFLLLPSVPGNEEWIILYNVFFHRFEFWVKRKVFQTNLIEQENHYSKYILQPVRMLFSGEDINSFLISWIKYFS
jgi:arginine-tRNA-protein transferase